MANDEAAPEVPPLELPATAPHRPQTFRFSRPLRYFIRALVFLARNSWHLNKTMEDNPKIAFAKTREQFTAAA